MFLILLSGSTVGLFVHVMVDSELQFVYHQSHTPPEVSGHLVSHHIQCSLMVICRRKAEVGITCISFHLLGLDAIVHSISPMLLTMCFNFCVTFLLVLTGGFEHTNLSLLLPEMESLPYHFKD